MKTFHEVLNPQLCQCNPDIRRVEIRSFPFLHDACAESIKGFDLAFRSMGLKEGEEISPLRYQDGIFAVVTRGAFKVYRYINEVDFVVFDILTSGDFFLYSQDTSEGMNMFTYPDIVSSLTTSCLLFMERPSLEALLKRDVKLTLFMLQEVTNRLAQQNDRFVRFVAYTAEQRLAFLLESLWAKGPKKISYPNLIPFNLSRKDLAAMAGLTLETTSRVLSSFKHEGVLRSGRGWIEIVDHGALTRLYPSTFL